MVQSHYDRAEKLVAMTKIHSHVVGMMDGAAIFNPLVDAPPEPPPLPLSSYQHSVPHHFGTTIPSTSPTTSGTVPIEPNYYYSSSLAKQQSQQSQPPYSHSTMDYGSSSSSPTSTLYDWEGQFQQQQLQQQRRRERRKHHSCRMVVLLAFLYIVLLSWKRHYWPLLKNNQGQASTTNSLPMIMNFVDQLDRAWVKYLRDGGKDVDTQQVAGNRSAWSNNNTTANQMKYHSIDRKTR